VQAGRSDRGHAGRLQNNLEGLRQLECAPSPGKAEGALLGRSQVLLIPVVLRTRHHGPIYINPPPLNEAPLEKAQAIIDGKRLSKQRVGRGFKEFL